MSASIRTSTTPGTVAKRVTVATSAHAPAAPASDEDRARPGVLGERAGAAAPTAAPTATAVASHANASVTVPAGAARSTSA